jgi:hypothetical protein
MHSIRVNSIRELRMLSFALGEAASGISGGVSNGVSYVSRLRLLTVAVRAMSTAATGLAHILTTNAAGARGNNAPASSSSTTNTTTTSPLHSSSSSRLPYHEWVAQKRGLVFGGERVRQLYYGDDGWV